MAGAVSRADRLRRYGLPVPLSGLVALVYYVTAQAGLQQELVRGQVTPLWPPTGIALAALLFLGLRTAPGIAVGAFLVNLEPGPSVFATAAIALGNTAAPVCSCLVLRGIGFRTEMNRLRDALGLIVLGALGGMLISATVGSGVLVLSGALTGADFWPTWWVWWTGDAMGVLIVAPFLFVLLRIRRPVAVFPARWAEAGLLLASTVIVAVLATHSTLNLLFLVTPFIIWAAVRFQLAGAAPCALIVSVIAIAAAADGTGPFEGHDLFAQMFTLQAFNGTTALTALLLSALITERNTTQRQIARVCRDLTDVLAALAPDAASRRGPPERGADPAYEP